MYSQKSLSTVVGIRNTRCPPTLAAGMSHVKPRVRPPIHSLTFVHGPPIGRSQTSHELPVVALVLKCILTRVHRLGRIHSFGLCESTFPRASGSPVVFTIWLTPSACRRIHRNS